MGFIKKEYTGRSWGQSSKVPIRCVSGTWPPSWQRIFHGLMGIGQFIILIHTHTHTHTHPFNSHLFQMNLG